MTSQKLINRKMSTEPSASGGLNPEATSPPVRTASVTPKPPGVRLKLLAVNASPIDQDHFRPRHAGSDRENCSHQTTHTGEPIDE